MKKFREYLEKVCETGKLPRGFTQYMVIVLFKIYNDLVLNGKSTFIEGDICKILNRFGIQTKECGIGYLAYIK